MSKEELLKLVEEHCILFGLEYNPEKQSLLYDTLINNLNTHIFEYEDKGYLIGALVEHPFFSGLTAIECGFFCKAKGKGKDLIKQFESWAKARGARNTTLTSFTDKDVSPYYKRLGYRLVEQTYSKELN